MAESIVRYTFNYTLSNTILHDTVSDKYITLKNQDNYEFNREICLSLLIEGVEIENLIQSIIKKYFCNHLSIVE